jgi:hypothetical protein
LSAAIASGMPMTTAAVFAIERDCAHDHDHGDNFNRHRDETPKIINAPTLAPSRMGDHWPGQRLPR